MILKNIWLFFVICLIGLSCMGSFSDAKKKEHKKTKLKHGKNSTSHKGTHKQVAVSAIKIEPIPEPVNQTEAPKKSKKTKLRKLKSRLDDNEKPKHTLRQRNHHGKLKMK